MPCTHNPLRSTEEACNAPSGTITYADTLYFFALLNAIQNAREVIQIAAFLFRTDYEGGQGEREKG